jgi:hypothetical protein
VSDETTKRIAEMNDRFRLNFHVPCFGRREVPGHIVCTAGIAALLPAGRTVEVTYEDDNLTIALITLAAAVTVNNAINDIIIGADNGSVNMSVSSSNTTIIMMEKS